jgi:tetratricopeptide (TPR) repeat protein
MSGKRKIVFLSVPESLRGQSEHIAIDPDIPLPVEIPEGENLNIEELSWEMIIAGMLSVIADGSREEWADYYRHFVLAVRPGIMDEFAEVAILKARNGDFDLALEILDSLQGLSPSSPVVARSRELVMEEKASLLERQKAGSIESIDKNSFEDENFSTAYRFIQEGNAEQGLRHIHNFIEQHPMVWSGWFILGWALRCLSRWEDAAAAFGKTIELGGGNSDTRNELAICLMEKGDLRGARRELEAALHDNPESVKIISNLGVLALKNGNTDEAAAFFRTVLELDPDDPIAKKFCH